MKNILKNWLMILFVALTISSCSRKDYTHGPMATPAYGLPPITVKLQNKLIEVLNQTDELDEMVKRGCTSEEFSSAGEPIEKSAIELQDVLPPNDPRIYLFIGTIEKYQELEAPIENHESKDELKAADLLAGMRKVFLLKVLNGTLDDDEQKMFDNIKEQIQSGKM
jgi:hypothetical protein